jgi:hypothetical protein
VGEVGVSAPSPRSLWCSCSLALCISEGSSLRVTVFCLRGPIRVGGGGLLEPVARMLSRREALVDEDVLRLRTGAEDEEEDVLG